MYASTHTHSIRSPTTFRGTVVGAPPHTAGGHRCPIFVPRSQLFRLISPLAATMARNLRVMATLFALLSRAGAFVPPRATSASSFASKTATNTAARPRSTERFSYRPSNTAVVMAAEKKAVFGGGCFWWVGAVYSPSRQWGSGDI